MSEFSEIINIATKLSTSTIAEIKKLGDGITNDNYKITTDDGEEIVARISKGHSIDRKLEKEYVENYLSEVNINSDVYDVKLFNDDYLITKFVHSASNYDIEELVRQFKIIHNFKSVSNTRLDPLELMYSYMNHYQLVMQTSNNKVNPKFKEIYKAAESVIKTKLNYLDKNNSKLVPSHNDCNQYNVLSDNGNPIVIDWEYAGVNYEEFDFASMMLEPSDWNTTYDEIISNNQDFIDIIDSEYYENGQMLNLGNLKACMEIQDLLWSVWSFPFISTVYFERSNLNKDSEHKKDIEEFYTDYAINRYNRFLNNYDNKYYRNTSSPILIPAAGKGSRFKEFSKLSKKYHLPVSGNSTLLSELIDRALEYTSEVFISVQSDDMVTKNYLRKYYPDVQIINIVKYTKGNMYPVYESMKEIKKVSDNVEKVIVVSADLYIKDDARYSHYNLFESIEMYRNCVVVGSKYDIYENEWVVGYDDNIYKFSTSAPGLPIIGVYSFDIDEFLSESTRLLYEENVINIEEDYFDEVYDKGNLTDLKYTVVPPHQLVHEVDTFDDYVELLTKIKEGGDIND